MHSITIKLQLFDISRSIFDSLIVQIFTELIQSVNLSHRRMDIWSLFGCTKHRARLLPRKGMFKLTLFRLGSERDGCARRNTNPKETKRKIFRTTNGRRSETDEAERWVAIKVKRLEMPAILWYSAQLRVLAALPRRYSLKTASREAQEKKKGHEIRQDLKRRSKRNERRQKAAKEFLISRWRWYVEPSLLERYKKLLSLTKRDIWFRVFFFPPFFSFSVKAFLARLAVFERLIVLDKLARFTYVRLIVFYISFITLFSP